MSLTDSSCRAIGLCAALFILAGCGGSQVAGMAALSPSNTTAEVAHRQGDSWILPNAKSEDLIYATGGCGGTCVLSYSDGTVVGSLDVDGSGDCADTAGNVFIPSSTKVVEYAHGGTTPINTLNLPGNSAFGCSVDPATGNLAVVFSSNYGNIAVFPSAQGTPTIYNAPVDLPLFCGYDNAGNFYVDGVSSANPSFAELKAGSSDFTELTLNGSIGNPGQIQWDGKYITYESVTKYKVNIARLNISGTTATVIGKTNFKGLTGYAGQSWIYRGSVIVPFGTRGQHASTPKIGVWKYPRGGRPQEKFTKFQGSTDFHAVTLSLQASGRQLKGQIR
jgi:hypothetical protein